MTDPAIRPATPADLRAIEAIVAAAYALYVARIERKPGPMLDDYAARIAAGQAHVLEEDGAVRGLAVVVPEPDALLLDNVAVAPEAAGRGLGRRLVAHAEALARAAGLPRVRLYTHERMTENRAMYPRLGFVETHRAEEKGFARVYFEKRLS